MKAKIILIALILMNLVSFQYTQAETSNWTIVIDADFCETVSDGIWANISDCRWYYSCDGGNMTAHQCPDGLVFDLWTRTCNFPWRAFHGALNCPDYP